MTTFFILCRHFLWLMLCTTIELVRPVLDDREQSTDERWWEVEYKCLLPGLVHGADVTLLLTPASVLSSGSLTAILALLPLSFQMSPLGSSAIGILCSGWALCPRALSSEMPFSANTPWVGLPALSPLLTHWFHLCSSVFSLFSSFSVLS